MHVNEKPAKIFLLIVRIYHVVPEWFLLISHKHCAAINHPLVVGRAKNKQTLLCTEVGKCIDCYGAGRQYKSNLKTWVSIVLNMFQKKKILSKWRCTFTYLSARIS